MIMTTNIHYPRTARVEPLASVGHLVARQPTKSVPSVGQMIWVFRVLTLGVTSVVEASNPRGGGKGDQNPGFVAAASEDPAATQLHWDFHKSQAILGTPTNPSV